MTSSSHFCTINDDASLSEFKFPYDCSVDESDLKLEPIGWGKPASNPTDPLVHPDWPKLRDASLSTNP